jgi:Fic family protein
MSEFKYFELKVIPPSFSSPLTNLIIDLDHLRKKPLYGSTSPFLFFQLKNIFHWLESLASARIEGNNTTVADYIETKMSAKPSSDVAIKEIENMEECLAFIDEHSDTLEIDRAFVSELHKRVVRGLPLPPAGEGDPTPGAYREHSAKIKNSQHALPPPALIAPYMDELFQFIKAPDEPKYDLIKIAIAHHRFVWIHPFLNGNGRTVRLFTYAMLVKYGFAVNRGRILNPAAVFCDKRDDYYDNLSLADTGEDDKILVWCQYVLEGLKREIEKIDKLLDYSFLREKILLPAIAHITERKLVTEQESRILKRIATSDTQTIVAGDIRDIVNTKYSSDRSRVIRRLRQSGMLSAFEESPRKYYLRFDNNYLLRGIINALYDEGFVTLL